jgi:hypothetical protein
LLLAVNDLIFDCRLHAAFDNLFHFFLSVLVLAVIFVLFLFLFFFLLYANFPSVAVFQVQKFLCDILETAELFQESFKQQIFQFVLFVDSCLLSAELVRFIMTNVIRL